MITEVSIHLKKVPVVLRKGSFLSNSQWLEIGSHVVIHGTPEQLDALIDKLYALKGTVSTGTSTVEDALTESAA